MQRAVYNDKVWMCFYVNECMYVHSSHIQALTHISMHTHAHSTHLFTRIHINTHASVHKCMHTHTHTHI